MGSTKKFVGAVSQNTVRCSKLILGRDISWGCVQCHGMTLIGPLTLP